MSYASVSSHNAPPPSMQPQPDPSLSNTKHASDTENGDENGSDKDAKRHFERAEQESSQLWGRLKEQFIRPGVAGGLLGMVNVGLLGTLSYQLYTQPHLRTDGKVLGGSAAGALIVLAAEGYLAEAYRNTAQGKEEERRAREEGAALYKHAKEIILRPNVLGGLMGIVNLGVIGRVTYVAYDKWDQPYWDRGTMALVSVGLLSLLVCEGILAERYKEKQYPKRR